MILVTPDRRVEFDALDGHGRVPGRIAQTDRRWVTVWTESGTVRASCTTEAKDVVTGDWVAVDPTAERVEAVMERRTAFVRRAAKGALAPQTLAANMDLVLCVHGMVPGVSPRRLERELVLGHQSGADVAVVLTKSDLVSTDELERQVDVARHVAPGCAVFALSSVDGSGVSDLAASFPPGCTVSLFGSSGFIT